MLKIYVVEVTSNFQLNNQSFRIRKMSLSHLRRFSLVGDSHLFSQVMFNYARGLHKRVWQPEISLLIMLINYFSRGLLHDRSNSKSEFDMKLANDGYNLISNKSH